MLRICLCDPLPLFLPRFFNPNFSFFRFLLRDYMCIGVNAERIATVTHCQRASIWNYDPKVKLVKKWVAKSQSSFSQILHLSPIVDNITQPRYASCWVLPKKFEAFSILQQVNCGFSNIGAKFLVTFSLIFNHHITSSVLSFATSAILSSAVFFSTFKLVNFSLQ